jgi:hypothetical protein
MTTPTTVERANPSICAGLEAERVYRLVIQNWAVTCGPPGRMCQVARRWTSQTVTAMSRTDRASSQPPSIHWKGQNRVGGW